MSNVRNSTARLLALAIVPLCVATASISFAQTPPAQAPSNTVARNTPLPPRDFSNIRSEFSKVQTRMDAVQRDFDRAARTNSPEVREQGLKDWARALDGLEPYVKQLSPAVPAELQLINQFTHWRELYNEAAGTAQAGQFFLQTTKYWSQITAGTDGWEDEKQPENAANTFSAFVKAAPDDAAAQSLGLPKTLGFIKAANTYINEVVARPDFVKFKDSPNVKQDLGLAMSARSRAQVKFATAVNAALVEAGGANALDQSGRDKLDGFVEGDLSSALASYSGESDLVARGRQLVFEYDKKTVGEEKAVENARARFAAAAEREWPGILARYATKPMTSADAGRGQIVMIANAKNLIGKQFGVDNYDFADYVGNAPVVGNFAPGVKEAIAKTLKQTKMDKLPDDTVYDLVAVLRGNAQVPNVKQRPAATTAPATADEAAATTSPAVTNCVVLEIIAVKAGPVAVGTDVTPMPER